MIILGWLFIVVFLIIGGGIYGVLTLFRGPGYDRWKEFHRH